MTSLKATILQNFATIGIPELEDGNDDSSTCELSRSWSVLGLSQYLIDLDKLKGLQHLRTRRLDLVIHDGVSIAHLNLQAFKLFQSQLATTALNKSIANYITSDGGLLFCLQTSGNIHILYQELGKLKVIKKPGSFNPVKESPGWISRIISKLRNLFGNKVTPTDVFDTPTRLSSSLTPTPSSLWWKTQASASISKKGLREEMKTVFPSITSVPNGLTVLCCYSPTDCFIFISTYDTALRVRQVQNIRSKDVPGTWSRIIMHKQFLTDWLEDRDSSPLFEGKLVQDSGTSVQGGMLYAAMENLQLELIYGAIQFINEKFTVAWNVSHFDVDWALRELDGLPYSLGSNFVTRLSNDCTRICVVICNHLGMYVHIQNVQEGSQNPVQMKRQKVALCNHSDFDGFHFYKEECWVSDVQWLVEDAYISVITSCGSLSLFHNTGEPMILKVKKPGPLANEEKSARFFYPVFHPYQIVRDHGGGQEYPKLKWMDGEKVLTCSSGKKIELFEIRRVIPLSLGQQLDDIWLGNEYGAGFEPSKETVRVEEITGDDTLVIIQEVETRLARVEEEDESDMELNENMKEEKKIEEKVEKDSLEVKGSWEDNLREKFQFGKTRSSGKDTGQEENVQNENHIEPSLEDTSGESKQTSRENLEKIREEEESPDTGDELQEICEDDPRTDHVVIELPLKEEEDNANFNCNTVGEKPEDNQIQPCLIRLPVEQPPPPPHYDVPVHIAAVDREISPPVSDPLVPDITLTEENECIEESTEVNWQEIPPVEPSCVLKPEPGKTDNELGSNPNVDTSSRMIPLTTFSETHSLARLVAYNDEYTDGSCSEADIDGGFLAPMPTLIHRIGLRASPEQKPSNQYMADDEAEEEEPPDVRISQVHWVYDRLPEQLIPPTYSTSIQEISAAVPLRRDTPIEEDSSEYPMPSSDTDYSSPFSCPPTTAEASDTDQRFRVLPSFLGTQTLPVSSQVHLQNPLVPGISMASVEPLSTRYIPPLQHSPRSHVENLPISTNGNAPPLLATESDVVTTLYSGAFTTPSPSPSVQKL